MTLHRVHGFCLSLLVLFLAVQLQAATSIYKAAIDTPTGTTTDHVAAADFNGDGKSDLVLWRVSPTIRTLARERVFRLASFGRVLYTR